MPRPSVRRAAPTRVVTLVTALVALLLLLGTVAPAGAAEDDPDATSDPLRVHFTDITPTMAPDLDQQLRISGNVTNHSDAPWSEINLYTVTSASPITDRDELAEAAATPAQSYIGNRITLEGTYATVAALEPGETASFELTVPRAALGIPDAPGVYWLGVHALATGPEGRDGFADGRARTFLPQPQDVGDEPLGSEEPGVPEAPSVESAVVVPLQAPIGYGPAGRVEGLQSWTRKLTDGGQLEKLLDLAAKDRPITWLVDPAVLDVVTRLAAGNPPRSLAPATSASSEGSDSDAAPGAMSSTVPEEELTQGEQDAAAAASAWLERFHATVADADVLALPYGDLDVSAASEHSPDTYRRAVRRSEQVMAELEVPARLAITSPSGTVSSQTVRRAPKGAVVLLSDRSVEGTPSAAGTGRIAGHRVLVTSSGAADGGPLPGDPHNSLNVRQRVAAEATLRQVSGSQAPLVTVLPPDWAVNHPSEIFPSGRLPWLQPVTVDELLAGASRSEEPQLAMDDAEDPAAPPLRGSVFGRTATVASEGTLLESILTEPSTVRRQLGDEMLTNLSHSDRLHPGRAIAHARATRRHLNTLLDSIAIEAPRSLTLSSGSGSLGASVINGLDQAVTVRVDSKTDPGLKVAEQDTVRVAPNSRTRMLLDVTAANSGIHDVRLVATNEHGRHVGASAELPVRAAQVSGLIWFIMGGGLVLLLGAIAIRLVRRIRGRNTDEGDR